ncbi:ankyrin repeat domain-containing protein [Kribbella sp. NPDC005582]|uniref:ankyrin repeat domain-containing protein n=1 Tax=Kribbella sp. NPDC005582 TaxID=3156893 RepID=UPI0033B6EA9C
MHTALSSQLANWVAPVALVGIGVLVTTVVLLRRRARDRALRQRAFFRAAMDDHDSTRFDEFVRAGDALNLRDSEGNTALHLAQYQQHEEAVRRLIARGADETLVNKLGFTPADMAKLGSYERMLLTTARKLTLQGSWAADGPAARESYNQLRRAHQRFYQPALTRTAVANPHERRRIVVLAVKLGRTSSEEPLLELLRVWGDRELAEDFLNCGSPALARGAERWARAHGFVIRRYGGSSRPVRWGRY